MAAIWTRSSSALADCLVPLARFADLCAAGARLLRRIANSGHGAQVRRPIPRLARPAHHIHLCDRREA